MTSENQLHMFGMFMIDRVVGNCMTLLLLIYEKVINTTKLITYSWMLYTILNLWKRISFTIKKETPIKMQNLGVEVRIMTSPV